MATLERPRIRSYIEFGQDPRYPRHILVCDQLGLCKRPVCVTWDEFRCLRLFDGQRTLRDIQVEAMRLLGGELLPLDVITGLVERLDQACLLEGPRFRERLAGPVREPRHIGCYKGEREALRKQVEQLFTGRKGPGLPRPGKPDGRLRAALVPHIDYPRGGHSYAWGYKELFERTDASLFVIIGTSHYSGHRFTLTRKHFQTPLGIVPTDQAYIDKLVQHYGDGLFDDELCHLPEHSIELEVVFLQYLYEGLRPIRIVPLVVGSFRDCVVTGNQPKHRDDIGRMVEALKRTEAETPEPICYVISGDLAHIGPKFEDPHPVSEPQLDHSWKQDQAILRQAEAADPAGYFQVIADEDDRRRICGLPPTYTVLEAIRPSHGKVLHHDRFVDPEGYESVSFASVAFYA